MHYDNQFGSEDSTPDRPHGWDYYFKSIFDSIFRRDYEDSDSNFPEDTEMGFHSPDSVPPLRTTCIPKFSAFEALHSEPPVFPSSLAALIPNSRVVSRPLISPPHDPPPDFPSLPEPVMRNY